MTDTTIEPGKIEIARVIRETFAVIARNLPAYLILSLILWGVPGLIANFLLYRGDGEGGFAFGAPQLFVTLTSLVTAAVLQGALTYATVQDLNNKKPSVGDTLATGLRAFLPILLVSILFALAVVLGMVLLIVPGVIAACIWCVAVPSVVAERRSVFGGFGRSRELTKGNRWRVFALLLIWMVAVWILSLAIGALGAPAFSVENGLSASPAYLVASVIVGTLTSMVGAAGVAVLYVELRKAREGVGGEWLASIFS